MDRCRIAVLARILVLLVLALTAVPAGAAPVDERMSLQEAIDAVRAAGVDVAYSSQLVKPWMRVRFVPESTDPLVALRQLLAQYSLALEQGPGDRWLVVKGEPPAQRRIAVSQSREATPANATIVKPLLEEITIVASRYALFSRDGTSEQFLTSDEIRLMPHIADDAFRALHRLPGVAASDFQAPFNLRGGASDEVKVVLDGLELFEPYHMRTLFSPLSIIDPGVIGQAQMLSGGYTADYGNHMSGVIDISSTPAEGAPVNQLGVSFVSSFARSSGRFASDRAGYQVSARRGYLDLIADTVTDPGEELSPRYSDLFAKLNVRLNDSIDLTAHLLSAADDVEMVDPDDGVNSNGDSTLNYAWLTIAAEPNDSLHTSTMVFTGGVDTAEAGTLRNLPEENVIRTFDREIEISGVQHDLVWKVGDSLIWKAGARYRHLAADFDYHIDSLRQTDVANNGEPYTLVRDIVTSSDGEEYGAYAAVRMQPLDQLTFELGYRWDKQTYTDTTSETQVSPRINALYRLGDRTEIRLGWGRYFQPQGIQDLQVQDGVTNYLPRQQSVHRIAGIRHRQAAGLEVQFDIYEKRYSDLRPRFENALDTYEFPPESNFDRIRIAPDRALTRGVELTLRKRQSSGLDWWLSYTWAEANDVVDSISVRRSWDQRHAIAGNLTLRGERWSLSAIARYRSGWPRTPLLVLPVFDAGGGFIGANSDLSQRNSRDFGDYSRVDLRLSRTVALPRSQFEYYVELFNVFSTKNECCVPDHNLEFGTSVIASPNFDNFLPFFPSFGFVWTFGPGAVGN